MKHSMIFFGLSVLAICLSVATVVRADTIGSTSTLDLSGTPTADGSRTGNLSTATMFALGNFTIAGGTGFLSPLTFLSLGPLSFDTTVGNSVVFGSPGSALGQFMSTSIAKTTAVVNGSPGVFILASGVFTPGTDFGSLAGVPITAAVTFSFSQVVPGVSNIGGGGGSFETFEIIPEPASMALLGTGLVGLAGVIRRRKIVRK